MPAFVESFDLTIYICYTLITSAGVYCLVALAVKAFGIKDPRLRARLFMLPLLLPVLCYLFLCPSSGRGCGQSDRLWFTLERFLCALRDRFSPYWTPFFLLLLAFSFLRVAIRFFAYLFFIRRCEPIAPGEAPELQQIVSELAAEAGISPPRLFWSGENRFPTCFTFGFWRANLAVSRSLLRHLKRDELRAVLAHEMGHLAGWDNFFGWLVVVCRDLMAFNPVAYMAYRSFLWEREKACDDYARRLTRQPIVLAQSLVKLGRLLRRGAHVALDQPGVAILGKQQGGLLSQRVERLVFPESLEPRWWHHFLSYLLTGGLIMLLLSAAC